MTYAKTDMYVTAHRLVSCYARIPIRRAVLARRPTPMLACLLALSSATSSMPSRITTIAPGNFARVLPSRVQAAFALEAASYPADEAATLENLQLRAEVAGEYFWGVSEGGALEGFICGTLTCGDTLTEESMSAHDPAGQTLCIHSVVVAEERRRLGLGSAMLKARHMCSMRTAMLHAAHCMCELLRVLDRSSARLPLPPNRPMSSRLPTTRPCAPYCSCARGP